MPAIEVAGTPPDTASEALKSTAAGSTTADSVFRVGNEKPAECGQYAAESVNLSADTARMAQVSSGVIASISRSNGLMRSLPRPVRLLMLRPAARAIPVKTERIEADLCKLLYVCCPICFHRSHTPTQSLKIPFWKPSNAPQICGHRAWHSGDSRNPFLAGTPRGRPNGKI